MKEVKTPKKPIIYYYCIVVLAVLLFNMLAMPYITQPTVTDVDYGKFMSMAEKKQIGQVEVQDEQIIFTSKDGQSFYRTGKMEYS